MLRFRCSFGGKALLTLALLVPFNTFFGIKASTAGLAQENPPTLYPSPASGGGKGGR
jgi:hypothetical protein